jgi:hypothetical protein
VERLTERATVNIVASTNADGSPFFESVLVEPVDDGSYRVLASPGLVEGIAAGDEIEMVAGRQGEFRLVKRGGNVCIQFFWDGDIDRCPLALAPRIEALGGRIDGQTSGLLVFTVPASAGFEAIEAIFYAAEKEYPGCGWMYGNVYDPADGKTPLDWWK